MSDPSRTEFYRLAHEQGQHRFGRETFEEFAKRPFGAPTAGHHRAVADDQA